MQLIGRDLDYARLCHPGLQCGTGCLPHAVLPGDLADRSVGGCIQPDQLVFLTSVKPAPDHDGPGLDLRVIAWLSGWRGANRCCIRRLGLCGSGRHWVLLLECLVAVDAVDGAGPWPCPSVISASDEVDPGT
jgi:hypothetical protein